jgi:hypothetical protein
MDVTTVASVLSVPKARANPSQGHTKQPPDVNAGKALAKP